LPDFVNDYKTTFRLLWLFYIESRHLSRMLKI